MLKQERRDQIELGGIFLMTDKDSLKVIDNYYCSKKEDHKPTMWGKFQGLGQLSELLTHLLLNRRQEKPKGHHLIPHHLSTNKAAIHIINHFVQMALWKKPQDIVTMSLSFMLCINWGTSTSPIISGFVWPYKFKPQLYSFFSFFW